MKPLSVISLSTLLALLWASANAQMTEYKPLRDESPTDLFEDYSDCHTTAGQSSGIKQAMAAPTMNGPGATLANPTEGITAAIPNPFQTEDIKKQTDTIAGSQMDSYNTAFKACMSGRGYEVMPGKSAP